MFGEFEPALLEVARKEGLLKNILHDLPAGVITGIIALPLAIAFGIASGATPEQGLFTAIIGGALISLFSGSRFQIGGPTGAFIVVVYSIIHEFGMQGLIISTLMAGVMLIVFGALKLGSIIKFVPYPVTLGFTSGIAVIIAVTQLNDFLGLGLKDMPAEVSGRVHAYATNLSLFNWQALMLGVFSIIIIIGLRKVSSRIPAALLAVILLSALVVLVSLDVQTIGSRYGQLKSSFPGFSFPDFDFALLVKLFPSAMSIAVLGAIESLLSAVVADGMTGRRHRSNMELVGQGIANVVTPLFGGIPSTGAIARTATNIHNGGKTPLSGVIHAITLLLIVLILGRYASYIPMAVLAGILLVVAFGMSEYKLFIKMFKAPKSDISVMILTFLLTVFVDLTVAIPTGMVLAAFLFMRRMEQVAGGSVVNAENSPAPSEDDPYAIGNFEIPPHVTVYEINGPFFFGAAKKFQDELLDHKPKVLILRMRNVNAIDATGIFALEDIIASCKKHGCTVLVSAIHQQPLNALHKSGIHNYLESREIFLNIASALDYARKIVSQSEE